MIGDAWIEDYPQYTTCILYNLLLPGKGEKKKKKKKRIKAVSCGTKFVMRYEDYCEFRLEA